MNDSNLPSADLQATLQTATEIAHAAGAVVRDRFGATQRVTFKGEVDPVTEADTTAEALILRSLQDAFPSHRILAEEGGWARTSHAADDAPVWMVDPLDGTNNFAHGFPHVGVSIALVYRGEPVVGVIHDPLREETFAATQGGGATLNGKLITVSQVDRLEGAFLATGFPYDRRSAPDNNVARLDRFLRRSQGVRRAGAATLDLAYVACGRFDGFWEIRLKPWDVAAGVLLVREAGGVVTDFSGSPECLEGSQVLASNGRIHAEMLQVISQD